MSRMGDLAATDSYNPFDAETFLPPALAEQTKLMAGKDVDTVRAIGGAMGDLASLPQRAIENSQYSLGTGDYDPRVPMEAALMTMGGGIGGTGAKAGETALTAGYDPNLWHGVSSIKLPKPVSEMSSILRPVNPAPETVISPARLQNSMLMPLLGDRTASAAMLERVNGFPFENAVPLQGGHGYMANNPEMAWAAGKSIAPGIAKVAREGAETGLPVHGVYTAMGERSADFSHMVSDTLAEMAKHTKITDKGAQIFNDTMKKIAPDFPGVLSPDVAGYLRGAPGELRNVFAKTMDTGVMQKHGFPSVAEARVAVTDPRLLHEPTGAAGLSIARMDPKGALGPSGHATYDTGIAGDYIGGLPASIPKEVMFPDIVGPLGKHADAVAQARIDAGKKPFRPTEDYLMGRTPKGLPRLQEANQQWVDSVSKHLEDRGFTLGSGATDKKGAAAIQGIRAYHGSPHDFDRFDLSKIGTGEGAQAYGHGLYFAGNEGVARSYRDTLGMNNKRWLVDGDVVGQYGQNGTPLGGAAARLRQIMGEDGIVTPAHVEAAQSKLLKTAASNPGLIRDVPGQLKAMDALAGRQVAEDSSGHMYEVNINADPAHLLDWDKPLREQGIVDRLPPQFLDAAKREAYNRALASTSKSRADELWSMVKDPTRAPGGFAVEAGKYMRAPEISADLAERGIPGIKYLDQGSRTAGKGSSNYVMFDDKLIDILKKYGIAAPAGMGALAAQDNYSE